MKRIIIAIYVLITQQTFSQKILSDTIKVDSNTKIIGWCPYTDKTLKEYSFILEDSATIVQFVDNLKIGKKGLNIRDKEGLTISVIKNNNLIVNSHIYPRFRSIMIGGKSYNFDFDQVKQLNKLYPFKHTSKKKHFTHKSEFDIFFKRQTQNPKFLFCYEPSFLYEGCFEITFDKTDQFSDPKVAMDTLAPLIEKIVSKKDYSVGYRVDSRNSSDREHFIITISGSKKLFKTLRVNTLKNKNWKGFRKRESWAFYIK